MSRFLALVLLICMTACGKKSATPSAGADPMQETLHRLRTGSKTDRYPAMLALAGMGDKAKEAVPDLLEIAADDQDAGLRATALEALRKIDPQNPSVRSLLVRRSLDMLGKAMHQYSELRGSLPSTCTIATQKDGRQVREPGLSWRVTILPFLGQEELYRQFKLDESWDSPTNQKLIEKMPRVYASPLGSPEDKPGFTHYQVFTAGGLETSWKAIFHHPWAVARNNAVPRKLETIQDGTSNTILVVEASKPVIWTKPEDLMIASPLPQLGHSVEDVFHVCMADGRTETFSRYASAAELRATISPSDGIPIDFSRLDPKRVVKPKGPLGQARGHVLIDGQPLASGVIVFHSEPEGFEYGAELIDGSYRIDNVPHGRYRVSVTLPEKAEDGKPVSFKLPDRYADPSRSTLKAEMRDESPPLNFDLMSR